MHFRIGYCFLAKILGECMEYIITFIKLIKNGFQYKVTKRIPSLYISETRFFRKKKEAMQQLKEWNHS